MKPHSILITDSSDVFRCGLIAILKKIKNVRNICTAKNPSEIHTIIENAELDLVCLDIDMPRIDFEELISGIKLRNA